MTASFPTIKLLPCQPPFWARDGHAQTMLGHLIPSPRLPQPGERVELPLPDGDRLVARWFENPRPSHTTVSVFHGLGGSTDAGYMHRTALLALAQGHHALLVNHRGSGEGAGLARGTPHSGRAEDVSSALEWVRAKRPEDRHIAVGFSMSGNALLLLLSGARGRVLPDRAVAVNAPIDLDDAALRLERGLNRIYDVRFVNELRRDMEFRRARGLITRDVPVPRRATLRDFDDLYTAPLNNFRDRADYYATCSTQARLGTIQVPTFILTASDDPFVNAEGYRSAQPSRSVTMHIEKIGGHMGYLSSRPTPLGSTRWMDYALAEILRAASAA